MATPQRPTRTTVTNAIRAARREGLHDLVHDLEVMRDQAGRPGAEHPEILAYLRTGETAAPAPAPVLPRRLPAGPRPFPMPRPQRRPAPPAAAPASVGPQWPSTGEGYALLFAEQLGANPKRPETVAAVGAWAALGLPIGDMHAWMSVLGVHGASTGRLCLQRGFTAVALHTVVGHLAVWRWLRGGETVDAVLARAADLGVLLAG